MQSRAWRCHYRPMMNRVMNVLKTCPDGVAFLPDGDYRFSVDNESEIKPPCGVHVIPSGLRARTSSPPGVRRDDGPSVDARPVKRWWMRRSRLRNSRSRAAGRQRPIRKAFAGRHGTRRGSQMPDSRQNITGDEGESSRADAISLWRGPMKASCTGPEQNRREWLRAVELAAERTCIGRRDPGASRSEPKATGQCIDVRSRYEGPETTEPTTRAVGLQGFLASAAHHANGAGPVRGDDSDGAHIGTRSRGPAHDIGQQHELRLLDQGGQLLQRFGREGVVGRF